MSEVTCPACGRANSAEQWACSGCGLPFARQYDVSLRPVRCPVCGGELMHGRAELRIGAGSGIGTLVDAGLAWSFLPVATATCLRCGHMDLYAL